MFFYNRKDPKVNQIRELVIKTKYIMKPDDHLKDIEYVVFDTETTGFHPYAGDRIISIGGVKLINGEITDEFHTLINPERDIPREIEELTGINEQDLQNQPYILDAIISFLNFSENTYLVAHSADFDLHFINVVLKQTCKTRVYHPLLDTMALSYHLYPNRKSYQLEELLSIYNIPISKRHHALEDARMTALLFQNYLTELEIRGINTIGKLKRGFPTVCIQSPPIYF